jgi:cytochrome c-type biogenesis protein CcmH/NrfG
MVARLAERMRSTPEDTDGWIMLARSYAAPRTLRRVDRRL